MTRILYVLKKWEAQGVPTYHSSLILFLLRKGYDSLIFIQEQQGNPKQLLHISCPLSKWKIIGNIIKKKPDFLVIFNYFGSPFVLPLLIISKVFGVKTVIVTDFTEIGLPRLRKSPLKALKELARYILLYLQLLLVDAPVCYTKYEIDVLSRIKSSRDKYRVIHIGNNIEIGTSEKENYILTVSRWWSDRKNLHTILKVFSEVIKEVDCKLVVVGKFTTGRYYILDEDRWERGDEYKQKVTKLLKELDLEKYVEFVGVKIGKELQELYRKAKIFYLPSKNETFGMVYVEAMASGTPIVAMKNSAVQYVVIDGVTGFLRNDEEGQKEAILKLLTDEKLYKEMQKNCLKEAEKYRWENVIRRWERLIKELVEGKDVC